MTSGDVFVGHGTAALSGPFIVQRKQPLADRRERCSGPGAVVEEVELGGSANVARLGLDEDLAHEGRDGLDGARHFEDSGRGEPASTRRACTRFPTAQMRASR